MLSTVKFFPEYISNDIHQDSTSYLRRSLVNIFTASTAQYDSKPGTSLFNVDQETYTSPMTRESLSFITDATVIQAGASKLREGYQRSACQDHSFYAHSLFSFLRATAL